MFIVVANQKSRDDAKVIADLDRHTHSLAVVLEPISKMDISEISSNLGTDAYPACIHSDVLGSLADCVHSELSVLASMWNKGKNPAFSINSLVLVKMEMRYFHVSAESIKGALEEFRISVWHCVFGEHSSDPHVLRLREL